MLSSRRNEDAQPCAARPPKQLAGGWTLDAGLARFVCAPDISGAAPVSFVVSWIRAVMNISTILAIAGLSCVAVNALHWRQRSGERFLYQPQSGWLRFIFVAWMIATGVAAVLFLAGEIPGLAFLSVTLGMTSAHQLYSMAQRQHQRAT
jgi:hypothetical protein